MKKARFITTLLISHFSFFVFTTCGISEYYYLPYVDEYRIQMNMTTNAEISLPSISSDYYYIEKFTIFYRIYLSTVPVENVTLTDMQTINRQLHEDYNYFDRTFIDVTNPTAPSANTFINRNYYDIETSSSVLNTRAGAGAKTIQIIFSAGQEAIIRDLSTNQDHIIFRKNSPEFQLVPDEIFLFNTDLLIYNDETGPNKIYNRDVIGTANTSYSTIYVSMYIVTQGYNSSTFEVFFSRPTHIGVFRLQP